MHSNEENEKIGKRNDVMIFTEDLLEVLSKKDPHIRFFLDTYEECMKEERIVFYDSLTRKKYMYCFKYKNAKLSFSIDQYADFSISENIRVRKLEQTFLPIFISSIKEHPTFRIKLALKEYSIDDSLLNKNVSYDYSFNDLLEKKFDEIDNYYSVFLFSFLVFCVSLFMLYLAVTHLSSVTLYITLVILASIITIFLVTLINFFNPFYTSLKEYFQLKKIKKLERKKIK